jgi:hypothetical protein
MANTRVGAHSSFATLPFDQIDGVAGGFVHEDFIGAALLADFVNSTGVAYSGAPSSLWFGAESAGDSVANLTVPVSVADHQGIIRLETGATTPADGDIASLQFGSSAVGVQNAYLPDNNGLYVAAVLRIADVDAQKVEFGLTGQAPAAVNSSVLDVVSVVWDPEDAANVGDELFLCQTNAAGTDTETATSEMQYVEGDWVLIEIAVTNTDSVFRITSEDTTETISHAAAPAVALRPFFAVEAVGAAEEVLDIDLFHMRFLRRDANFADWLGA